MITMKTDMAGGGAVIARHGRARRRSTCPSGSPGLVAAGREHAVGQRRPARRRHHATTAARTVEVFNTDAEGRLVLADALAYADAELDPDVARRPRDADRRARSASAAHGGLYATDDAVAAGARAAATRSGERVWRMPLVEDYRAALDSDVADLAHICATGGAGGSITAALFLREFAGDRRGPTWTSPAGPRRDGTSHEGPHRLRRPAAAGWLVGRAARGVGCERVGAGARPQASRLIGGEQPVADGQQRRCTQPLVLAHRLHQLAQRHRLGVALGRVGDPVVPERVVEGHHAAGAQQPQRLLEVGGVLALVAVDEHQVVGGVGQARHHVERAAVDQAHAVGGDAGLGEGLAGQPLVLALDVDAWSGRRRAHAAQHPQGGHAGAGADLDDRAGVEQRGEEAQRGAAAGADRDAADLLGAGTGGREDGVLGDEGLGELPARLHGVR